MKINRKSLSILSLALLLALFGGAFSGVRAQTAQSCTPDSEDHNTTNDAECPDDSSEDDTSCLVVGAVPDAETNDGGDNLAQASATEEVDAAETQDDQSADAETQDDQGADGETADDNTQPQDPAYVGSIAIDEAALEGMAPAEECTALIDLATVTPEEAQAAAQAETGATVAKVELDNENGYLIYSAELEDGRDVKVDAGNGNILAVEAPDNPNE
jgi:uncharacterized membrane protein YkoI